jgi:uncharacterized damage-inducible protein DinB
LTAYQDVESVPVDTLLVEAFRYNRWANLHLLDVCSKLPEKRLDLTAPGTYGTIAATFHHLVNAERRYIWRLNGARGRFSVRHRFPGLAVLSEQSARSGDELIEVAKRIKGDDAVVTTFGRRRFKVQLWVILLQALHHGNDHRTHVCTILGRHGIPYGELDVWAYGELVGALVPGA